MNYCIVYRDKQMDIPTV
uniref:Uncharacterized protein n=1 Tax=Arundo donax TaxID=35708 RepID=A0A0A9EMW5_ARUDO